MCRISNLRPELGRSPRWFRFDYCGYCESYQPHLKMRSVKGMRFPYFKGCEYSQIFFEDWTKEKTLDVQSNSILRSFNTHLILAALSPLRSKDRTGRNEKDGVLSRELLHKNPFFPGMCWDCRQQVFQEERCRKSERRQAFPALTQGELMSDSEELESRL